MAEKTLNTVIVLRNGSKEAWEAENSYKLRPGEVGVGYMSVTTGEGDAAVTKSVPIIKVGTDGETAWKDLPQAEGVFEEDQILTYNFGRHTTSNGFVNAGGKGMTTSEWLRDALSEIKEPTITQPTFTLTASGTGAGGEIGDYITALKWDGTTTYGSYEYGPATGLSAANRTWSISNDIDSQTSTKEDGTFTLTSDKYIQLTQEASKTYATITGTYSLDASGAADPFNNVGVATSGKITDKSGTIEAAVKATAYRKVFWGVLAAGSALDVENLTSADIRGLSKNGKSLPTSLDVAAGSQMVIFAAKAGTKSSLTAKDTAAMNAGVGFTKVANAVAVEGANGFEAVDYDIWYVDWNPDKVEGYTGIGSAKKLSLTWA